MHVQHISEWGCLHSICSSVAVCGFLNVCLSMCRASRLTCSLVWSCLNQTTLCSFQPSRRTVRRWTCNQQTPLWRRSYRYTHAYCVQCDWPQFHLVSCTRNSNRSWCVRLRSTYLHTYIHMYVRTYVLCKYIHTYIFTHAHRDLLYTVHERTVIVTCMHEVFGMYVGTFYITYIHMYTCMYVRTCIVLFYAPIPPFPKPLVGRSMRWWLCVTGSW